MFCSDVFVIMSVTLESLTCSKSWPSKSAGKRTVPEHNFESAIGPKMNFGTW
jgi:hypothetical protein